MQYYQSFLRRVINQLLFTSVEVLTILMLSAGVVGYAVLVEVKRTSQEVAQLSSFFENEVLSSVSNTLSSVANQVATANIATMTLWAIVGALVYIIFLGGLSFLKGVSDTVWSSFRFTHPVGHSASQFFFFSVLERLAQMALLFVFFVYSIALVNAVFPFVFDQISSRVDTYSADTLWILLYIVQLALALHVWVFLWRLVRGSHWKDQKGF